MTDKPKHTPGPWLFEGQTVYALNKGGPNRFSCAMQSGWLHGYGRAARRVSQDELDANARLIIAAPTMASALAQALQYMTGGIPAPVPGDNRPPEPEAVRTVRAALTDALGII